MLIDIMIFIMHIKFLFGIIMVRDHGKITAIITRTIPKATIMGNIRKPLEKGRIKRNTKNIMLLTNRKI